MSADGDKPYATQIAGDSVEDVAARFKRELKERAGKIKSVRNDVYSVKYWQLALNFVLGGGAVAALIVSMVRVGTASVVCVVLGIALAAAVIIYNIALRARTPMSFLQYTRVEKGKRYCFWILSKNRSVFWDGENVVEVDRMEIFRPDEPYFMQYRFDFFADMSATRHCVKGEKDVYKGTFEHDGKSLKCKIVFKNGVPIVGTVGGARIKYFDVNNDRERFVVPSELRRAVKECGVSFPKLAGIFVRDDRDATKQ